MNRLTERLVKPSGGSSFISQRVQLLTSRIFSIALAISFYEASRNAFAQRDYIQPIWFWLTWGFLAATLLYALVESFIFNRGRIGFGTHAVGVVFTLVAWQWQLSGVSLPTDYRPWIWWEIGVASLCAGLAFAPAIGWPLLFAIPIYWYFFRQQTFSGGPDPMRGLQDAIYSVLFAAVVVSMIDLMNLFARRADESSEQAREALVSQARADAVERARLESDNEVHSKILATLEAAYNADPDKEHPAIAESAEQALQSLRNFANSYTTIQEQVTVRYFFDALGKTAKEQFESVEIDFNGFSQVKIDFEVANAFSDATMQALDNSYKHAGGKDVNRKLHLRAKPNGFKIVIEDDGRGFRPANVPKDRLGVRRTIRGRVESVGGTVKIDSLPGQGARVVLEWGNSQ